MMAAYNILRKSISTPDTDAILAEVRVQALEQFAVQQESISEKYPAGSYGQESAYEAAQCAREFAEQLRQETPNEQHRQTGATRALFTKTCT